ncbi:THUMP domain-containing protein [bacterium]|nr:THUMP domain-containing protein [bacterium]
MYLYQESHRYFAQTAEDLRDLAEEELRFLDAQSIKPVYRGLHFTAAPHVLYTINFRARLINRVLAPLIAFNCHSDRTLYKKAREIEWRDFLTPPETLAVFANVANSAIKHSKFAALRLKDAIIDYFRDRIGQRPSIDTENPQVWVHLFIENNRATVSLDTSGGSLHRRGYRVQSVDAPMMETLAAAIIRLTDWNGENTLYDPFCGSGTLLCEAYMHARNLPAAFRRIKFGLEALPDFDAQLWDEVKKKTNLLTKPLDQGRIRGSDISSDAVEAAAKNCSQIDSDGVIEVHQHDVFELDGIQNQTIVCNPPYGIRLDKWRDLSAFYKRLGDFLKQRCTGSTAYIYFGERKYIKNVGLRSSWKKPLSNGGLDGRLVKYELY